MCCTIVYGDLKLLVIGGETLHVRYKSKVILQDVELLDPFDADSDCIPPPDLPFPRKCMVSEYLDQRPFIVGGSGGMMYDTSLVLVNNTWIDTPIRLNHSRYCAISSQPKSKTMWVLGGDVQGTHTGMTSEILQHFKIKTDNGTVTKSTFNDTVNAPIDIRYSKNDRKCASKINDTHLFLVGYHSNVSYIVNTSKQPYTFQTLPQMKFGSHNGGACATLNDSLGVTRLFVAGGGNAQLDKINLELMIKTEFFDFVTNEWIEGPDLPRLFYMGGVVQYPDERGVILIGGQDLTNFGRNQYKPQYFSDLIRYNQTRNIFEYLPKSLDIPRSRFGAMLVETINENCTIFSKITTSHANSTLPELLKMMMWFITIYIVSVPTGVW